MWEMSERMEALSDIPFDMDVHVLLDTLHIEAGSKDAKEVESLVSEARTLAHPKALYKEAYVDARGSETVTIDGVTFTSRALRANLAKIERVFPYVATCGEELDQIELAPGDILKQFWLDTIKATVLGFSTKYLSEYLQHRYALGKTSKMNPGAGDVTVWPIEQQRDLFSLFGDVKALIGVELTDSFLMVPNKSVSGIRFPTEIDFRSCQLCHRDDCPGRSAPFDEQLWESMQLR